MRRFLVPALAVAMVVAGLLVLASAALGDAIMNTALPTISGTAQEGQMLTANPGTWTGTQPITFTYQWEDCDTNGANCSSILAAIGPTYIVQATDTGKLIRVQVTVHDGDGDSASGTSALPSPTNTSPPGISGTPQQPQTLTVQQGTWTPTPSSFSHQWQDCDASGANCSNIPGATGTGYRLTANDVGRKIVVVETAADEGGSGSPTTSAAVGPILPPPPANVVLKAPAGAVTNQNITLFGAVTSSAGSPSGTITFMVGPAPIRGCVNEAITPSDPTATCTTPFSAATSPEQLSTVFVADSSSDVGSSSSASVIVSVDRANTTTSLDVSNPTVDVGSTATYKATVSPSNTGPFTPTGSVAFTDGGAPITGCGAQPVNGGVATCTVRYRRSGSHNVAAHYGSDSNFNASTSQTQQVTVHQLPPRVLGTIKATMQWTFFFTPIFTAVRTLVINGAPVGASVTVTCHGRGCPFGVHRIPIQRPKPCRSTKTHKCHAPRAGTVDLLSRFQPLRHRQLKVGTQIVITITRRQWIGKYYSFTVRRAHPPRVRIDCLAAAGTKPGVGC